MNKFGKPAWLQRKASAANAHVHTSRWGEALHNANCSVAGEKGDSPFDNDDDDNDDDDDIDDIDDAKIFSAARTFSKNLIGATRSISSKSRQNRSYHREF